MSFWNKIFSNKQICPYCNNIIQEEIKRKSKCANCDKFIFVRAGRLLSKNDAAIFDWIKKLEIYEPHVKNLFEKEKELSKLKYGKIILVRDIIWRVILKLINSAMKNSDFHKLFLLYTEAGLFSEEEGKMKNAKQNYQLATKMLITEFLQNKGIKSVRIVTAADSEMCDKCGKLDGEIIDIKKAYLNPPVPILKCKNKRCRCTLFPIY